MEEKGMGYPGTPENDEEYIRRKAGLEFGLVQIL